MVKECLNWTRTISSFSAPSLLRLTRISIRGDRQMIRHLNTSAFTDSPSISWDWRITIPQAYKLVLDSDLQNTMIFLVQITLKLFLNGRSLTRLCNIEKMCADARCAGERNEMK